MKSLTTQQAMRYSRQIMLAGFDLDKQEALLNSNVLLIGLGGLGCAAAQYLVAAGIGHITLVDDDFVEHSNLQRQVLHTEQDIRVNKAVSAQQSLLALNSACEIKVIQQRLSDEQLNELARQHHTIVDCCDNLQTRNQLNQASVKTKTPLVSGAAIRMEGQVCTFIPSDVNACYACLSTLFSEQTLTCVEAGVMSPVVGIIGSMQALETIKVLTQFKQTLTNKLQIFDASNSQWQLLNIAKNPICKVCSTLTK